MKKALIVLLSLPLLLFAQVTVEVEVHGERAAAHHPIEGFIYVQRPEGEAVDCGSFRLGGRSLPVEFLHDSMHSSVTILNGTRSERRSVKSLYRFRMPGVDPGEYVLPVISVLVGHRRYQSEPTPYFVYSAEACEDFRLHAFVRGEQPFYPGQQTSFVYRLAFTQAVDPIVEALPLLEAKGFRKLGDPVITTEVQGDMTIQEIVQSVQAVAPGTYTFESSVVEGLPYRRDFFGRRLYDKNRLRAVVDGLEVIVAPFPEEGKPTDFNGALGRFKLEVSLLSPTTVVVGDRLRLQVALKGVGVWSTVRAPDLAQQRQFERDFRLSDLPPEAESVEDEKQFVFELRPLTAAVTEIPAIRFSSFDPEQREYVQCVSEPIPIRVDLLPLADESAAVVVAEVAPAVEEVVTLPEEEQRKVEIAGVMPLMAAELNRDRPPWQLLWLFPAAALAWLIQWGVREILVKRQPGERSLSSQALLKQARQLWGLDPGRALRDLEAGLLLLLYERGHTNDVVATANDLRAEEPVGGVRRLISRLHASQYGAGEELEVDALFGEVRGLCDTL